MPVFVTEPDPEVFAARAEALLLADPVLHTLPLGVLLAVRAGHYPTWHLCRVESDAGDVLAVGVRTPPHNQIVAATDPAASRELAAGLAEIGAELPGVTGVVPAVQEFAAHWSARTGMRVEQQMAERLFRLDRLVPPRPAKGFARAATDKDADLLTDRFARFRQEVGIEAGLDPRAATEHAIREGRRFVWERDGRVVCDVGHSAPAGGQVRIGPVYTPPEHRGLGYASNLTAHVTAGTQRAGHVPTLFTDLANPTSNGIYQALGYRAVADAFMLRFVAASDPAVA